MSQIIEQNSENHGEASSAPSLGTPVPDDISASQPSAGIPMHNATLPSPLPEASTALPAHLEQLADRARGYVEASSSANTRKAYASDWKHFSGWCRRQGLEILPPNPHTVGLYITACAGGSDAVTASGAAIAGRKPNSVTTIERRLSAITWNYAQRGTPLDRRDRHIATVLAGIRNTHAAPPRQKEAVLPEHLIAMLETLPRGTLRGLRDRAMLLIGFAGGLRRSEIVGLDVGRDQTKDSRGWVEILDKGMVVTVRGKRGWREVEIGRGSSDATCPVVALRTWLNLARIAHGPLFRRVTGQGKDVGSDRLLDQEVARLVKKVALAAGVRPDLTEAERAEKFSGHSLRAGLASSAEVDERYVQNQLGHASAEMTRKYQRRRDRFRVNLTKASGL
ncbi:site-specific integrase [Rhizobium leguminosarum]|uniref:Integrase n=1 Tax=Rhizobium leguminosarum TaxID=384 RepID=A0A1B1CHK4_RHILE|nr:site-specific integrase [Rhizobium leguminosarum]ANP89255.1 integrase [Rhizobium leguminosarum]ANP90567.1 integrase [Rhizobium leguminosarum]ANP90982.1 integrase [Rhizobium leguminosarum]ANP91568.1 integrase [Rhizobium leguminosarum]